MGQPIRFSLADTWNWDSETQVAGSVPCNEMNPLREWVLLSGESLFADHHGGMGGAENSLSCISWEKVNVPDHERAKRWRGLVGVPWGQQEDTESKLDDVFGVGTEREESLISCCWEAS